MTEKQEILTDIDDILSQVNKLAERVEQLPDDEENKPLNAYRLLKDMPQLNKGTVFLHDKDDSEKGNLGCGSMKNAWYRGNCQKANGAHAWGSEAHVLPGQLARDREWFEPIENDGRYHL